MLNKYLSKFKVCREKVKLYNYVKSVVVNKIEQIEDSLIYSNDLNYSVLALENSRYLNPELGKQLAKSAKLIFHNHDLSKLKSANFACQLLNALHLYVDESDIQLYREIYKFYQRHPYLFDKNLINRLEYYYFQFAQKSTFSDDIQIDNKIAAISNTRMFTPVALELYNIKQQNYWNIVVRYDPEKLTSTATLQHKSGITLRIQGVFPNNYEDITDTKTLIQDKKFDVVILNMPPFGVEFTKQHKQFNILDKITDNIEEGKVYKEKVEQVFISEYEPIIAEMKKKLKIDETKHILTGVHQGYEVPFTMESLVYQFYKQRGEPDQPFLILAGINQQDRLKLYLNTIDPIKIAKELSALRFQWLNQIFSHVARAQKTGCFICGSQPEGIVPPSKILDETPAIKKIQTDFLSDITLKYIGSSRKKKMLLVVHESLFYDTLRNIVSTEVVKNDFDIDDYRAETLKQKLSQAVNNQKHYSIFSQFYEDTQHTDQIYKLCQEEALDLNKLSKLKYQPGIQIRCGVRDILF